MICCKVVTAGHAPANPTDPLTQCHHELPSSGIRCYRVTIADDPGNSDGVIAESCKACGENCRIHSVIDLVERAHELKASLTQLSEARETCLSIVRRRLS
ncbi:MAG: hypothetical protein V2A73_20485, partial [Pseudomonadota bacterium]